jgi:hypothetical protein
VQWFAWKFHITFDEDSMIGRETFAWIFHRLKEGRTPCSYSTRNGHRLCDLYPMESTVRFAGGVPIIATYGEIHQLPAVGENCLFDKTSGDIVYVDEEG